MKLKWYRQNNEMRDQTSKVCAPWAKFSEITVCQEESEGQEATEQGVSSWANVGPHIRQGLQWTKTRNCPCKPLKSLVSSKQWHFSFECWWRWRLHNTIVERWKKIICIISFSFLLFFSTHSWIHQFNQWMTRLRYINVQQRLYFPADQVTWTSVPSLQDMAAHSP